MKITVHPECARLAGVVPKEPFDVALVGIGENAHLTFNDPPANFEAAAPYLVVELDEACRRQQVGEGWFSSLAEVPTRAISMSIPRILALRTIICSVPDARKAEAVRNSVEGPVRSPWGLARVIPPCDSGGRSMHNLTRCLLLALALVSGTSRAATTTYTTAWSGGVIAPGDTVVVENGGSITGNVTANGTLRFNQTTALTLSGTVSGTGALTLSNSGTVALAGLSSGTGRYNLAITAASGELAIGSTGTNAVIIGETGQGSLTITGGGVVRNGAGYLGFAAGSVGTATVASGTWFNAAGSSGRILYVGASGTGSLDISGGTVTNSSGYLGFAAGSRGTAVVSSGTWQNRGTLYVGGQIGGTGGDGALTISGGQVTSITAYVGCNATAVGNVVLTGGTWTSSANLNVGTSGPGTLTISGSGGAGGTVVVGGTLARGAAGTIVLDPGGTLQIGTGSATGALATNLVNNGSLVFNRTGTATVANTISGSGSLTLANSGTLAFSGMNSFTGPTTINAGALSVTGALGATAVAVNAGGRLFGSGSIAGPVTVRAGGVVSPGAGIESLAVGALTLLDGSAFVAEVHSAAPQSAAADLLSVAGNLALTGTVDLTLIDLAVTPAAFAYGTTLSLASYTGTWNGGLFRYGGTTLADGSTFSLGTQLWMIDYDAASGGANFMGDQVAGGGFVNLVAVPEPATVALLLVGVAAGGLGTRRHKASGSRR